MIQLMGFEMLHLKTWEAAPQSCQLQHEEPTTVSPGQWQISYTQPMSPTAPIAQDTHISDGAQGGEAIAWGRN